MNATGIRAIERRIEQQEARLAGTEAEERDAVERLEMIQRRRLAFEEEISELRAALDEVAGSEL